MLVSDTESRQLQHTLLYIPPVCGCLSQRNFVHINGWPEKCAEWL